MRNGEKKLRRYCDSVEAKNFERMKSKNNIGGVLFMYLLGR